MLLLRNLGTPAFSAALSCHITILTHIISLRTVRVNILAVYIHVLQKYLPCHSCCWLHEHSVFICSAIQTRVCHRGWPQILRYGDMGKNQAKAKRLTWDIWRSILHCKQLKLTELWEPRKMNQRLSLAWVQPNQIMQNLKQNHSYDWKINVHQRQAHSNSGAVACSTGLYLFQWKICAWATTDLVLN